MKICEYCSKQFREKRLIGKVTNITNRTINVEVFAKTVLDKNGKPKELRDNEFLFFLRRNSEFNFCSVKCMVEFMGYGDKEK